MRRDERIGNIWDNMKGRCYNPNKSDYKYYGARGIVVCEEWKNSYHLFEKWSLENGYDDTLTIDRINNNGNYTPDNCRWANMKEQCNNRTNNVFIDYNGEKITLSEFENKYNISQKLVNTYLKRGIQIEDIIKMCTYFKIGEVSKLLKLTQRQLRLLHDKNILVPDFIHKNNRYYSKENIKKFEERRV